LAQARIAATAEERMNAVAMRRIEEERALSRRRRRILRNFDEDESDNEATTQDMQPSQELVEQSAANESAIVSESAEATELLPSAQDQHAAAPDASLQHESVVLLSAAVEPEHSQATSESLTSSSIVARTGILELIRVKFHQTSPMFPPCCLSNLDLAPKRRVRVAAVLSDDESDGDHQEATTMSEAQAQDVVPFAYCATLS
jgi:hypothetical protein